MWGLGMKVVFELPNKFNPLSAPEYGEKTGIGFVHVVVADCEYADQSRYNHGTELGLDTCITNSNDELVYRVEQDTHASF